MKAALIVIAMFVGCAVCVSLVPDPDPEVERARTARRAAEKKVDPCRADLECWSDKHHLDARMACTPLVEAYASYDTDWDFLADFDREIWVDKAAGIVSYHGRDVKFKNGFGAWQRMTYWCDYNPSSKTASITDIR